MTSPDRTTPPAISQVTGLILPTMDEIVLPGGATLHIYDGCDTPVNAITVIRHGGNAEADNSAMAEIYAKMHREGSKNFTGAQLADILDYNGSWMATSCTPHHLSLKYFSLNSKMKNVLPAIADSTLHPAFPEEALEVNRHATANRIAVEREKVQYLAAECSTRSIMGITHPLSQPVVPDDAMAVTAESLHEMSAKFADASNLHIYVAGKITPDILSRISDAFSTDAPSRPATPLDIKPFSSEPASLTPSIIDRPGSKQSAIHITLPAIGRHHPDYVALHLAVTALGGYFGSRLMQNIREEKGLTYGISAGLLGYLDGGYTLISTECDNAYTVQVVDEIRHELRRLATDPCCGEELMRLRQSASASLLEVIETPFSIASYRVLEQTTGMTSDYFDSKQKMLENLTPELISDVAKRYLDPDNILITIAGDRKAMPF